MIIIVLVSSPSYYRIDCEIGNMTLKQTNILIYFSSLSNKCTYSAVDVASMSNRNIKRKNNFKKPDVLRTMDILRPADKIMMMVYLILKKR